MAIIESVSNPSIKKIKKIAKGREPNYFVIEGKKLLTEALGTGLQLEEILYTPEFASKEKIWLQQIDSRNRKTQIVTGAVMKSISDLITPPGIMAIARKPQTKAPDTIVRFALLLVSIRDPGNFGAILRTAEACGCEWVAYTFDCADPYQPKVVRAAMGSLFRMPLIEVSDVSSFLKQKAEDFHTYGLEARAIIPLTRWKPRFPLLACIGSESRGLPPSLPLKERIAIPMKGKVESLNAAVAASVFLYYVGFQVK